MIFKLRKLKIVNAILLLLLIVTPILLFSADTDTGIGVTTAVDTRTGLWGPYWTDANTGMIVYLNSTFDVYFSKTTDGGANWTVGTRVEAGTDKGLHCYFDQETPGITDDKIHCIWADTTGSDKISYVAIDISSDSAGTVVDVDTSVTVAASDNSTKLAITKTRGGNLLMAFNTGTELAVYRSTDGGTNWTSRTDVFENIAQKDWVHLYPANTSDSNDAVALYQDVDASELSIKMYDDSANSWTESLIGPMNSDNTFPSIDAATRHSDGKILIGFHTNNDHATDDLATLTLTADSISSPATTTAVDIFTDQDNAGEVAMVINQQNDDVYIAYSKGGTWQTALDIVYHKSTNDMASWGTEQAYSEDTSASFNKFHGGRTVGDAGGRIQFVVFENSTPYVFVNLNNDIEITAATGGGEVISSDEVILFGF